MYYRTTLDSLSKSEPDFFSSWAYFFSLFISSHEDHYAKVVGVKALCQTLTLMAEQFNTYRKYSKKVNHSIFLRMHP